MTEQPSLPFPGRVLVRDVLGREREPDKTWPDGSYNCPFCFAAVHPEARPCPNPACTANPAFPIERAREAVARAEERAEEAHKRERLAEWTQKYREDSRRQALERVAAIQTEAMRRGACVRCALKDAPYRVKYVKHRGTCPLERKST
jgi:hypothetical protein